MLPEKLLQTLRLLCVAVIAPELPEKLLQTLRLLCVAVIAPESAVPPSWQGPFQTQRAKPRLRSCTLVQGLFSLSLCAQMPQSSFYPDTPAVPNKIIQI